MEKVPAGSSVVSWVRPRDWCLQLSVRAFYWVWGFHERVPDRFSLRWRRLCRRMLYDIGIAVCCTADPRRESLAAALFFHISCEFLSGETLFNTAFAILFHDFRLDICSMTVRTLPYSAIFQFCSGHNTIQYVIATLPSPPLPILYSLSLPLLYLILEKYWVFSVHGHGHGAGSCTFPPSLACFIYRVLVWVERG